HQQERSAPPDHVHAVVNEIFDRLHQPHLFRLAMSHSQENHAEVFLHLGVLKELVENNLRLASAFQLDYDPHSIAIGFVANVGDVFDGLVVNQLGDALDTISVRLCGGMFVAIPTAIPFEPLISRLGTRVGNTTGSKVDSSKLGTKSTVSLSMSLSISSEMRVMRHSVYR